MRSSEPGASVSLVWHPAPVPMEDTLQGADEYEAAKKRRLLKWGSSLLRL